MLCIVYLFLPVIPNSNRSFNKPFKNALRVSLGYPVLVKSQPAVQSGFNIWSIVSKVWFWNLSLPFHFLISLKNGWIVFWA